MLGQNYTFVLESFERNNNKVETASSRYPTYLNKAPEEFVNGKLMQKVPEIDKVSSVSQFGMEEFNKAEATPAQCYLYQSPHYCGGQNWRESDMLQFSGQVAPSSVAGSSRLSDATRFGFGSASIVESNQIFDFATHGTTPQELYQGENIGKVDTVEHTRVESEHEKPSLLSRAQSLERHRVPICEEQGDPSTTAEKRSGESIISSEEPTMALRNIGEEVSTSIAERHGKRQKLPPLLSNGKIKSRCRHCLPPYQKLSRKPSLQTYHPQKHSNNYEIIHHRILEAPGCNYEFVNTLVKGDINMAVLFDYTSDFWTQEHWQGRGRPQNPTIFPVWPGMCIISGFYKASGNSSRRWSESNYVRRDDEFGFSEDESKGESEAEYTSTDGSDVEIENTKKDLTYRTRWTNDEDRKILNWRKENRPWKWIQGQLKHRTEGAIKTRFHKLS